MPGASWLILLGPQIMHRTLTIKEILTFNANVSTHCSSLLQFAPLISAALRLGVIWVGAILFVYLVGRRGYRAPWASGRKRRK
jgi:hypothetical protein